MKKKLPAFMFYPGDWLKDNSLRVCSLQSRGLWIDLLCYMHESPQRGVLMITETKPMGIIHISQLVGHPVETVSELLGELVSNGVIDFNVEKGEDGSEVIVYSSRRMVRDEHKRDLCGKAGAKGGGNPNWRRGKGDDKQNTKSSSSLSSSSSSSLSSSDSDSPSEKRTAFKEITKMERFTSSEGFIAANASGVNQVWKAIPSNRRRKPATTKVAIGVALELVSDQDDPVEFLSGRIREYYASQEGQGKFHREPSRWLEEQGWEEHSDAWVNREDERVGL